jgi:zinc transport system substrate-binding protein
MSMTTRNSLSVRACVVALAAAGCSRDADPTAPRKTASGLAAVVSIVPQIQIVQRVGGPDVRVEALVGPDQSPHTFSITPSQIRRLSEAELFLAIGVDFELGALSRLRDTCPNLKIIETQAGIAHRSSAVEDEHDDHAGHHHDGPLDPHIWLDPIRVKQIAANMCEAFIEQNPTHAAGYRARLSGYLVELDALDADIKQRLAPYAGRTIIVYHSAFGYFADRYGLREIAIEMDGKAPGSRTLQRVVAAARENGVRTIFHEPRTNLSLVEAIAEEFGGRTVALDPLAPDLLANLRLVAEAIAASFEESPE